MTTFDFHHRKKESNVGFAANIHASKNNRAHVRPAAALVSTREIAPDRHACQPLIFTGMLAIWAPR